MRSVARSEFLLRVTFDNVDFRRETLHDQSSYEEKKSSVSRELREDGVDSREEGMFL
jgi:hypothetical protein